MDLIERLRARVKQHGGDRLLNEAAAAIEAARESLDREEALKGGVEHQRDTLWAELEAAREDAENSLGALRVAVLALASAAKGNPTYLPAYNHISAAIDQARGK